MKEEKPDPAGLNFTRTLHTDTYPAIDSASKSDCSGKHVFITGASKGIGRATALAYAQAGAGAIGVGARSDLSTLEKEIIDAADRVRKKPPKVLAVNLDVSDRLSVESAAGEVEASFGRLDILVNNAGNFEKLSPIADSDPDEWWKTWAVNVRGPYLMTRSFLPLLSKGGDKQIINLTSVGAHHTLPGMSGYQTTKLALIRFSEFISAEYGKQGVLSYAVHPGGILTDMAKALPKEMHPFLTDTPELAGNTIAYLTQERQEWLAGRYISCTWDMPEFFAKKEDIIQRDLLKVRMAV